jgi:hypothetical protein
LFVKHGSTSPATSALATLSPAERATVEFRRIAAEFRRLSIRAARVVRDVERTGAHVLGGYSSLGHFAERNGMCAAQAHELSNLGYALASDPAIEDAVRCAEIPVASAAVLGEISQASELARGNEAWAALARTLSTRELRRRWTRRKDEFREGEPVYALTAYVTPKVREAVGPGARPGLSKRPRGRDPRADDRGRRRRVARSPRSPSQG